MIGNNRETGRGLPRNYSSSIFSQNIRLTKTSETSLRLLGSDHKLEGVEYFPTIVPIPADCAFNSHEIKCFTNYKPLRSLSNLVSICMNYPAWIGNTLVRNRMTETTTLYSPIRNWCELIRFHETWPEVSRRKRFQRAVVIVVGFKRSTSHCLNLNYVESNNPIIKQLPQLIKLRSTKPYSENNMHCHFANKQGRMVKRWNRKQRYPQRRQIQHHQSIWNIQITYQCKPGSDSPNKRNDTLNCNPTTSMREDFRKCDMEQKDTWLFDLKNSTSRGKYTLDHFHRIVFQTNQEN